MENFGLGYKSHFNQWASILKMLPLYNEPIVKIYQVLRAIEQDLYHDFMSHSQFSLFI